MSNYKDFEIIAASFTSFYFILFLFFIKKTYIYLFLFKFMKQKG